MVLQKKLRWFKDTPVPGSKLSNFRKLSILRKIIYFKEIRKLENKKGAIAPMSLFLIGCYSGWTSIIL